MLHIIANTGVNKQELKDVLMPIMTASSSVGYLSRLILAGLVDVENSSVVGVGTNLLLGLLSVYGAETQSNNTNYNELVFNQ